MDIKHFAGMLQTKTSSFLRGEDELIHVVNAHGDEIGSLTQRLGYGQHGDALEVAQSVLGLHSYPDVSGGTENLLAYVNGKLKYNNSGTWTNIQTGLLADAKPEFVTFIDQTFIVGKNASGTYLTTAVIDGTSYSTTGNVTDAPQGSDIEVFADQVYILKGSKVYYSSLPDVAGTTITWNTTEDFFPVYTRNGEDAECIHTNKTINELLIFKPSSLHAWDTFRLRDAGNVGTTAKRSVATVDYVTMFYNKHKKKIYAYSGSLPQNVSRKIDKWVKGIQNPDDVFAIDEENEFYKFYAGQVIVSDGNENVTHNNCEFRYSLPDNTWTVYKWFDNFTVYTKHKVSGVERIYAGADDGEVHQLAKEGDAVYTDDGNAIGAEFMFELDLGVPSERKFIDRILIYSTQAQNLQGRVRARGKDWSSWFTIDKDELERSINPDDGRFLQFHFSSKSSNPPFKFEGISIAAKLTTKTYV